MTSYKPVSPGTVSLTSGAGAGRQGPVLLALHGREAGPAAIEAAHALAGRLGVALKVVTVIEVIPPFGGAPDLMPLAPGLMFVNGDAQADTVRRRVSDALGSQAAWALDVLTGSPAREIARAARENGASIVVIDAAPRRGVRRVVSGVRALQVVGRAPCPVLSIASWSGLPKVIVVPIDFSPASIRAATAALMISGDGVRVILVHVPWTVPLRHVIRDAAGGLMGGDVADHFARVLAELQPLVQNGTTIETRTREGSVVSAVLSVAESERADLIAAGSHGPGPVERFFVGSVAAGLVHAAPCPVLVSPPPGAAEFLRLELRMTGDAAADDPATWREVLAAASARNVGRVVDVEVDDPAIGAQVEATGYVLRGIDYDSIGRRVEVMLGGGPEGDAHLTRTIANVESIAIASAPDGRDAAIKIDQGRGHTLIQFAR